jgi:hypothetical protein
VGGDNLGDEDHMMVHGAGVQAVHNDLAWLAGRFSNGPLPEEGRMAKKFEYRINDFRTLSASIPFSFFLERSTPRLGGIKHG